jgi:FMN phosphatase YigB (HAD superfamily)
MARHSLPRYKGILIELNNVILTSSFKDINLPANTFKSILCCGATAEYQCGRITEDQYYTRLAKDFQLPREELIETFDIVRGTLRVDHSILSLMAQIKARSHNSLKVYATGNLSREDYALARMLPVDWDLFDGIFTSSSVGMRKPELQFFHHILDSIHLKPDEIIFIDDDTDHVLAAMTLGMQAILSNSVAVSQTLFNLVEDDTISRGQQFLRKNAKNLHSETHTGITIRENYAQLMILEVTNEMCVKFRVHWSLTIVLTLLQGVWWILNRTIPRGTILSVIISFAFTQTQANGGK